MATKPLSDEEEAALRAEMAQPLKSLAEDYNPKRDTQATFQSSAEACANEIVRIALRGENDPIRFKASVYVVERVTGRLQDQAPPLVDDKWAQFLSQGVDDESGSKSPAIIPDDHDEFEHQRIPSPQDLLVAQNKVREVVSNALVNDTPVQPAEILAIAEANRVRPPIPSPPESVSEVENDSQAPLSTEPIDVPPSMLMPTSYLTEGKDS